MSQEERAAGLLFDFTSVVEAKWSSVLCSRELGRHGEILSVELLRWAWRRLKQCRPGAPVDLKSMLEVAKVSKEELIPFGELLGPERGLEAICSAVDGVLAFGRLFFLRQRMWDAEPRATIELVQLLLVGSKRLLKAM